MTPELFSVSGPVHQRRGARGFLRLVPEEGAGGGGSHAVVFPSDAMRLESVLSWGRKYLLQRERGKGEREGGG